MEKDIQYTIFNVETLKQGKTMGTNIPLYRQRVQERTYYNTLIQSVLASQGSCHLKLTQLWLRSLMLYHVSHFSALQLQKLYSSSHSLFCAKHYVCPKCIYTLHHMGYLQM